MRKKEERAQEIRKMKDSGASYREIGEHFGISHSRAHEIIVGRYTRKQTLSRYRISPDEFDEMLFRQGGKCAICGSDTPNGRGTFAVDHCHTSGRIRGLLCHNCNKGLGSFRDNKNILLSAIKYLSE